MAKKQRSARPPRSADMSRYGGGASGPTPAQPGSKVAASGTASAGNGASTSAGSMSEADYATEYRYVSKDLRRIALLSGAMFVVLIVLSFVVA